MSETADPTSSSRSPSAILLPILAAIACVLCLPILAKHVKSRNLAASVLVFWIMLENVFNLINPLLWPTNDFKGWWDGVGFCDVESKLRLAAYIGYISALVCIYRQLAVILNTEQIVLVPSPARRRRRIAIEIALCFGFPVYIMVAHYVVQSGRYYIFAVTGCVPILDSSWPSIVLVVIWPTVMWIMAAVYCSVIIHRLIKYRRHISSILSAPQCRYNQSQFARLFAMSTALIIIFLPVALYILVQNSLYQGQHYSYSWIRIHDWTDSIFLVPSSGRQNFGRWLEVVTGFVVFISFGLGGDGLLMYRRLLLKLGLGKIFPRLKLRHNEEARAVLQSPWHTSLSTRFGSMSSRARMVFTRRSNDSPPSAPNMSPSTAGPVSSPTAEAEKGHKNSLASLEPVHRTDSIQSPISKAGSAQPWFSFKPDQRCGMLQHLQDDGICMGSLIQTPSPASLEHTQASPV